MKISQILVVGLSTLLAACGGDTEPDPGAALTPGQTPWNASAPPSSAGTTVPAAPPSSTVTIFAAPTPQEYVSLGASTNSAGGGYDSVVQDARLTSVFLDAADQPRLRYNAAGHYEIQLPGATWDPLIFYKGLEDPSPDHNFFQPSSYDQNYATFIISRSRFDGYRFSEIASWSKGDGAPYVGYLAFGESTPPDAVPTVGSATFVGSLFNMVDITYYDGLYGGYYFIGLEGTVALTADFAAQTLSGTVALDMNDGANQRAVGNYTIGPIALGSQINGLFSGLLVSDQSGHNGFKLVFTGPAAEEAIGALALPLTVDGQPHQLLGAWIAKRE